MSKDWRDPREEIYEHTFSGLRTGSEVLADLEAEREFERDREDGPVGFEGQTRCRNCGAYVWTIPCVLCGEGEAA